MPRVFAKARHPADYEAIFLACYDQICGWARQLTKSNEAEAEDLVQDAFIDFIHSRPDLSAVRNLDGFLYTIVRNIHRSQLQKHLRRRDLLLTAVDYDSAELGLRAAAPARLLEIREQLHRVCQFACDRKRKSKAGSLLILRFFHAYYPAEIAAIARWDRATVDARLGLVRREVRAYVEGPDRLRAIDSPAEPTSAAGPPTFESEAILGELRSRIFSAAEGTCLPEPRIRKLYDGKSLDAPDRGFLSHLVSCATCLDVVNKVLGLDNTSQRGFGESDGPRPVPLGRNFRQRQKSSAHRAKVAKWKRNALDISQHHPRELTIVVDGAPLAWQTITAEHNEFSIRLQTDQIEFVEIFSDQQVRLLSLSVPGYPPEVDWELRNEVLLSDNRRLTLALRFETLGPEVQVCYSEESRAEAAVPAPDSPRAVMARPRWRQVFRPQFALLTALLISAAALFLVPNRETAASAATVLMKAQASERSAGTQSGLVVHRSLRLEERPKGRPDVLSRRRVDVWRDGRKNAGIRRLYDEQGALLASSNEANTARPAAASDVWKYEPSAENFELLAGDLSEIKVDRNGESVRLATPLAGLTIQKDNWHASAGFVVLGEREYEFTETTFELIGTEASPLAPPPAVAEVRKVTSDTAPHVDPQASQGPNLEDVEMECRYELHRIGGDIGYPIEIRRDSGTAGVHLAVRGVVPSDERRQEIQSALMHPGMVRFELKTEDELARDAPAPGQGGAEIKVSSARSPIEKQLLDYFKQPADVEQFTRAVLASNEKLMAHAWALRRLSERYPNSSLPANGLSAVAMRELEEIVAAHRREMNAALHELSLTIRPAVLSFIEAPLPASAPGGLLFDRAQRVEEYVIALVSGSGLLGATAQENPEAAARGLLGALQALRGQLAETP
jgi:RNA polymerase sigma factor (sigma-70 family)